jgi:exonuclease SbcD
MERQPLFRFIHCSDLHLDSPFEGIQSVEPWVADILRKATFEAFQRVVNTAIQKKCDFVIISGDIYDGADRNLYAKLRFRELLKQLNEAQIKCYLVHGNHDPLSGWEPEISLPQGIFRFPGDKVSLIPFIKNHREIAHIYGISFQEKANINNLAKLYQKSSNEVFSIGILHCNVGGMSNHDNYAPCSIEDLVNTELDYWALGHIHTPMVIRKHHPIILYPGNTQGRNINEKGPRGCYLVQVYENQDVEYDFYPTDVVRWFQKGIDITNINHLDDLLTLLIEQREDTRRKADGHHAILRLTLKGMGELDQILRQKIDPEKDLAIHLREGENDKNPFVWIESILIQTQPPIDIEQRLLVDDFIGDFLRVIDKTKQVPNLQETLKSILSSRPEWSIIHQEMEAILNNHNGLEFLKEAELFGLEELLRNEKY